MRQMKRYIFFSAPQRLTKSQSADGSTKQLAVVTMGSSSLGVKGFLNTNTWAHFGSCQRQSQISAKPIRSSFIFNRVDVDKVPLAVHFTSFASSRLL